MNVSDWPDPLDDQEDYEAVYRPGVRDRSIRRHEEFMAEARAALELKAKRSALLEPDGQPS